MYTGRTKILCDETEITAQNVENHYCVYCHTSPSGKKYVGITGKAPEERWRKGQGYQGYPFYKAVQKYGWDNIEHEILEVGLTREEAVEREIYYVALYKSNDWHFGYNMTAGGEGCNGAPRSEKTKAILSEKCRGFTHTPEAIEKIRAQAKENWTHQEFRDRMKETHSGENHFLFGKHPSAKSVAEGVEKRKGFKHSPEWIAWAKERYKGEGNPNYGRKFGPEFCEIQRQQGLALMADPARRQHLRDSFERKQVAQYTADGLLIATYDGIHEAARQTEVPASNISLCCREQRKTACGYIWKFAQEATDVARA